MMRLVRHTLVPVGIGVITLVMAVAMVHAPRAAAADSNSLYTYDFRNLTGSYGTATVANQATANTSTSLALISGNGSAGSWSSDATGTTFSGNTTAGQSVAYGRPKSGNIINIPANQPVGFAVSFSYNADQCAVTKDSENLTQIGKFVTKQPQLKMQFATCANHGNKIFPDCRVAGLSTPTNDTANGDILADSVKAPGFGGLIVGNSYRVQCIKSGDSNTSKTGASVTIKVTLLDAVNGNTDYSYTQPIHATGAITLAATGGNYLSVGQKYTLPTQGDNTDQFNGTISTVSYCKGATTSEVDTCLASEVPTPPVGTAALKR